MQLMLGGCITTFGGQISGNAELQKLESSLPGLRERMITAARAHCESEGPKALATMRARVAKDWTANTTPAERSRLARVLAPMLARMGRASIDFRDGETAIQALERSVPDSAEDKAIQQGFQAFARRPGGTALLNKLFDYKKRFDGELTNSELHAVLLQAKATARAAANAYARENGFGDIYATSTP
jgi:hypothetical protein